MPRSRRRQRRPAGPPTLRQRLKGLGDVTLLVLLAVCALEAAWFGYVAASAGGPAIPHLATLPWRGWLHWQAPVLATVLLACTVTSALWASPPASWARSSSGGCWRADRRPAAHSRTSRTS